MNRLIIFLNQGYMPIIKELLPSGVFTIQSFCDRYILVSDTSLWYLLGDRIPYNIRFMRGLISIGDVLIIVGSLLMATSILAIFIKYRIRVCNKRKYNYV